MGILRWFSRLLGGEPSASPAPPGPSRREVRERQRPDYLPAPRRRPLRPGQLRRRNCEYQPTQLERFDLPLLQTPADLADALGISEGKLTWLAWPIADRASDHYHRREVPKSSGGKRQLCVPKAQTRAVQDWVFAQILRRVPVSAAAHGFIRGRSILTNARHHVGKQAVLSIDLEDFFPSISAGTVTGLFRWMGYPQDVAWHLSMLCTCPYGRRRALPQGSPTSPAISNLICWKLDRRLSGLARKHGLEYTRYGDDITFSGDGEFGDGVGSFVGLVRHICAQEGFRVNRRKTQVMRRQGRQQVTGIVVNDKPAISRRDVRLLRAVLHNCRTKGVASQNREQDPLFRERLQGKVALVQMVDAEKGARLRADFEAIDWGS